MNEIINIDETRYQSLYKMLNSGSEEDYLVALQCIKSLNKQRNYVAVAFLRKNTVCSHKLWEENCGPYLAYHKSLGLHVDGAHGVNITYKDIYYAMSKEPKYQEENKRFFAARYIEYLRSHLPKLDCIESIEINVKIKGYE